MNTTTARSGSVAWGYVRMTAWSMIIIGVVAACMSLLPGGIGLILLDDEVMQAMQESTELGAMPEWLPFVLSHLLHFSALTMGLSLLTIAAGFGMLQRQRWALWCSIGMFWIGAVSNVIGIWLHAVFLHNFRTYWQGLPEWTIKMVEANYWTAQISGAVFAAVFAAGFGWTAWKLGSAAVQAEFRRTNDLRHGVGSA